MKQTLSRRERQIVKMLLAEYTQQEICQVLNLHTNTVSDAKRRVMEKWDVNTLVGVVREAMKRGYLDWDLESSHNAVQAY